MFVKLSQASFVQGSPSLQALGSDGEQHAGTGVCTQIFEQPFWVPHPSTVQTLLSSQSSAAKQLHSVPLHLKTQIDWPATSVGWQASSVQYSPSLHIPGTLGSQSNV